MQGYEEFMEVKDYVEKINYHFASCQTMKEIDIKFMNLKLQINLESHNLTENEKYLLIELLSTRKTIAQRIRMEVDEENE